MRMREDSQFKQKQKSHNFHPSHQDSKSNSVFRVHETQDGTLRREQARLSLRLGALKALLNKGI